MQRIVIACLAAAAVGSLPAAAQEPPRHGRARPLAAPQRLAARTLLGGAIEAVVEAAPVGYTEPAYLNGEPAGGAADLHLVVRLRYAAAGLLGGRNAGEFVPYQKVHARIANVSTGREDDVVQFDLAPHVGHAAGWHYGSNVLLPPDGDDHDPFAAAYHVTITAAPAIAVALHADAEPPSRLFVSPEPLTVLDEEVVFGGVGALPVGDVGTQLERVAAFSAIKAALEQDDFAAARATFEKALRAPMTSRVDPAQYDAARGLDEDELGDLVDNVAAALDQEAVGPDCRVAGAAVPAECKEWIKKGLERFFYLSVLHEIDAAGALIARGELGVGAGAAHKWDEAWAYWQALRETAAKRQANCDSGRFGAVSCGMEAAVEDALLAGARALLESGGAGWEQARADVEQALLQVYYLAVVHELIAMREKILAGDPAGYNKARVEARAFYRTIAYLVPGADDAPLHAAFSDRDADLGQAGAANLLARLNAALAPRLDADRLAAPEVVP